MISPNRDTESTWRYHDLTKHSYWSIRTSPHYLDWSTRPSPFKIYPGIEPLPLPRSLVQTLAPAREVVASAGIESVGNNELDISRLASILFYSAGVTKHRTFPGGEIYFRAAACAGALYPTEIYVVCGDIEGLPAGVYHFNPGDFAFRRLREGDLRATLARARADETGVNMAPVSLIFTCISWRSTWKYRDRAYRYHFWDNGMIAANALALAAAHELAAEVVLGFVEPDVNKLIGIDGEQELALSLLLLGNSDVRLAASPLIEELPEIDFDVVPISPTQVDYPSIREMHSASSFADAGEVSEWRSARIHSDPRELEGEAFPLIPLAEANRASDCIEEVIQRRASTRRFARKAMPLADLSWIIDGATHGIPADFLRGETYLTDVYAIVNRVEGLPPGAYYYRRADRALELLKPGDFSDKAAYLTLEQELGGDACVTFFFMADLKSVLEAYGNRGYRAAQMEAGIIGGKMYLLAYDLKRGGTGLTFYDDDVTHFFSPHAADKSCMLVVSVGIPGKRPIV
ncbi:MAG: SagB family peptide dehydrogenase [Blastocatellia bacterium]